MTMTPAELVAKIMADFEAARKEKLEKAAELTAHQTAKLAHFAQIYGAGPKPHVTKHGHESFSKWWNAGYTDEPAYCNEKLSYSNSYGMPQHTTDYGSHYPLSHSMADYNPIPADLPKSKGKGFLAALNDLVEMGSVPVAASAPSPEDPVALAKGKIKHVKTAKGSEFYHLPLGAPIIAHPEQHNLEGDTRKLVYSNGKQYAVPSSAEVFAHEVAQGKNSGEKYAYYHGAWYVLAGDKPSIGTPQISDVLDNLRQNGSLKEEPAITQKSVALKGKPAIWVPKDAEVYVPAAAHAKGPHLAAHKYVKYQGKWYQISPDGMKPTTASATKMDSYLKNGNLKPDEPGPGVPAGALSPPSHHAELAQHHVTVAKALSSKELLTGKPEEKDTAAEAAAFKAELHKKFPQLKPKKPQPAFSPPPEDKPKTALEKVLSPEALKAHQAAVQAQKKPSPSQGKPGLSLGDILYAKSQAEIAASKLAPETPLSEPAKVDVGGIPVTPGEIAKAAEILQNAKGIMVKQPLAKAGHPLVAMDYHAVAKAHMAKTGHKEQTKPAILHHLAELSAGVHTTNAQDHVIHGEVQHHPETPHSPALPEKAKPGGESYVVSIGEAHDLPGGDLAEDALYSGDPETFIVKSAHTGLYVKQDVEPGAKGDSWWKVTPFAMTFHPAAGAAAHKPGLEPFEVDPAHPATMKMPGSQKILAAQALAKNYGVPRYIVKNPLFNSWVNSAEPPQDEDIPFWKVDPDGKVHFYPSVPATVLDSPPGAEQEKTSFKEGDHVSGATISGVKVSGVISGKGTLTTGKPFSYVTSQNGYVDLIADEDLAHKSEPKKPVPAADGGQFYLDVESAAASTGVKQSKLVIIHGWAQDAGKPFYYAKNQTPGDVPPKDPSEPYWKINPDGSVSYYAEGALTPEAPAATPSFVPGKPQEVDPSADSTLALPGADKLGDALIKAHSSKTVAYIRKNLAVPGEYKVTGIKPLGKTSYWTVNPGGEVFFTAGGDYGPAFAESGPGSPAIKHFASLGEAKKSDFPDSGYLAHAQNTAKDFDYGNVYVEVGTGGVVSVTEPPPHAAYWEVSQEGSALYHPAGSGPFGSALPGEAPQGKTWLDDAISSATQSSPTTSPEEWKFALIPQEVAQATAKAVPSGEGQNPEPKKISPESYKEEIKNLPTPPTSDLAGIFTAAARNVAIGNYPGGRYVIKHPYTEGYWYSSASKPDTAEYYHISPELDVTHVNAPGGGNTETLTPAQITDFLNQSGALPQGDIVNSAGVTVPKVQAGYTSLRVSPGYYYGGGAGKTALYLSPGGKPYQLGTDGNLKQINSSAFQKSYVSKGMTHWFEVPKSAKTTAAEQAAYDLQFQDITDLKPGAYHLLGHSTYKELLIHPDLTASAYGSQDNSPSVISQHILDNYLANGALVDENGMSVVRPGTVVNTPRILGMQYGKAGLQQLRSQLEETAGDPKAFQTLLTAFDNPEAKPYLERFILSHGISSPEQLRVELHSVANALLNTGELKSLGDKSLKPLGKAVVKDPSDIFDFTAKGHARPFEGAIPVHYSAQQAKDLIAAISQQYGGGKVIGTHPASIKADDRYKWLEAFRHGDMKTLFKLDVASGKTSESHPGAPGNKATHKISWAPWSETEVPSGDTIEGSWTDITKAAPSAPEVDNYIIKAGLKNAEYLTVPEKRSWMTSHIQHDQFAVDSLSKIAAKRAGTVTLQPMTPVPVWSDDVKPSKSYTTFVEDSVGPSSWTTGAVDEFVTDHADKLKPILAGYSVYGLDNLDNYDKRNLIQKYLDQVVAAELAEKMKPKYSLAEDVPPLGQSTQQIVQLKDQFGNIYLFKSVPKNGEFRAEVEHYAGQLGNLWGFKTPGSRLIEFDGKFGQAQSKLAAEGDILDLSAAKGPAAYTTPAIDFNLLTQQQLSDIAREHLLDWAESNDDGHMANFLRMPDGTIVGIDKGRAWKDLHWKGLSADSSMDSNAKTVYAALYKAIRDGEVDQGKIDQMYRDVIIRARRMQRLSDDTMSAVLEKAFASRSKFPAGYDKASYIKAILERKNALEADFEKMWEKVYKDAGLTKPEPPKPGLPNGLHSGFSSPGLMEEVHQNKSYGKAAFFAGTDIEDGHALTWVENHSTPWPPGSAQDPENGKFRRLRGQLQLRNDGLAKIMPWLKSHKTGENPAEQLSLVWNSPKPSDASTVYDVVLGAGKTVSHHAVDKQFNSSKMNQMASYKSELEKRLKKAEEAVQAGVSSDAYKNFTLKAGARPEQEASMAKHYLDLIHKVEEARDNGTKFKPGDIPEWTPPALAKIPVPQGTVAENPLTVSYGASYRELTDHDEEKGFLLDPETGELNVGSSKHQDGSSWKVTLPTGERIEIRDEHALKAHQGMVRYYANIGEGEASLERIRSALQDMGLEMRPAEEDDMELFYWHHIGNILLDRKDTNGNGGLSDKAKGFWAELSSGLKDAGVANNAGVFSGLVTSLTEAGLSPEQELAIWRRAADHFADTKEFVASQGYLPRFDHFDLRNQDAENGRPYWMRWDVTPDQMAGKSLPSSTWSRASAAEFVVKSGGAFATEGRLRALGYWHAGMSSTDDMGHGSSPYIFTRLNNDGPSNTIWFNPSVVARTSTYGYSGDQFGEVDKRASMSYWDMSKQYGQYTGGSGEHMIKDAVGLLNGVEMVAMSPESHTRTLSYLHGIGVTHIRGLPIEDRIVISASYSNDVSSKLSMIKKKMIEGMNGKTSW